MENTRIELVAGPLIMDRKAHWDTVYTTQAAEAVSWFQPEPTVSLRLLEKAGMTPAT